MKLRTEHGITWEKFASSSSAFD